MFAPQTFGTMIGVARAFDHRFAMCTNEIFDVADKGHFIGR